MARERLWLLKLLQVDFEQVCVAALRPPTIETWPSLSRQNSHGKSSSIILWMHRCAVRRWLSMVNWIPQPAGHIVCDPHGRTITVRLAGVQTQAGDIRRLEAAS